MLRLIVAFVEIAFHRRSPGDLPASRVFFGAVLAVYLVVGLVTTRYLHIVAYPELLVLFETALGLAFIWAVLRAFEHQRRFRQTACAVLGTDALLNLVTVPLVLWHGSLHAPDDARRRSRRSCSCSSRSGPSTSPPSSCRARSSVLMC